MVNNEKREFAPYERPEAEALEMIIERRFLQNTNEPVITEPSEEF